MASNPVRILHLIASNFVGGPEKQILHHALDIRSFGFDVWIGSFRDQPERAAILVQAQAAGLPVFESESSGRFDLRAVHELVSTIKRERIQLLCTHGFKANSIGVIAKTLAGVPQVAFCRGWTAETLRVRLYEILERQLIPFADRIVCVSEAQAEYFASRRWLRRRISIVHNAMLDSLGIPEECDREGSKVQLGFSPQTLLVGVVGRLSVEKGQRFLIDAAKELVGKFPNLRIVLLGEGRERENLEAQAREFGLEDVVMLPGFQKNVGTWMKAFDVVANCSLTEGIPNAILEAMAAGTPVVATDVGGVPALVKHRHTGLLVPPANPSSLAMAVSEVLADGSLASRLRQAGRDWVQTQFSAEGQRAALLELYRQCLEVTDGPAEAPEPVGRSGCDQRPPLISIVIPVRNEQAHLGRVLKDLLEQQYPPERYEILVADGQSTDGTAQIVEEAARASQVRIRLLTNPRQLSSSGRNVGVRGSSGEIVIFIDGHCRIPSKTFLSDAATIFAKTDAHCLCRPQPLNVRGNSSFQAVLANARATVLGHGRDSTIYNTDLEGFVNPSSAGAMYRRAVFERVGYYDESFDAAEDVEFNHRVFKAGLRSYISPRLAVLYEPRSTFRALWRQMMRYGRGRLRLIEKHRDAFSFAQPMPAIFLLWLVIGALGSLISPAFRLVFASSLAIYAGALLYFSIGMALRHGLLHLLLGPPVYLVIHLGLGAGFLAGALDARSGDKRFRNERFAHQTSQATSLEPPNSVGT